MIYFVPTHMATATIDERHPTAALLLLILPSRSSLGFMHKMGLIYFSWLLYEEKRHHHSSSSYEFSSPLSDSSKRGKGVVGVLWEWKTRSLAYSWAAAVTGKLL